MFSILIPTWNNLACLKLCINSLRRHSAHAHEILIHVNEGSDGTLDWLRSEGIDFSHSSGNIGICLAVNHLASQATSEWLVYMNDDMVVAPGWDTALLETIERHDSDLIYLSSTLIEPYPSTSPAIQTLDCGAQPTAFDEPRFLSHCARTNYPNHEGAASQPSLFSRRWFHMLGGYSLEFSPGMASDDDFLMKLWVAGCRTFEVVGGSKVYHFSRQSTGRIKNSKGGRTFAMKWGMTLDEFKRDYLARAHALKDGGFPHASVKGRLRRAGYGLFNDYPLADIEAWSAHPAARFPR
ncbi:MAG: glycosyltransferase family 2 protein [Pseudomonadota bacterium]|jgi:GT2 family glycosyltransferase